MKKLLALILATLMIVACFAGCGSSKKLVMGTNATFPPYEFVNDEGKKILYGKVYAIKPCNTKFVKSKICELDEEIEKSHFLSFSRV